MARRKSKAKQEEEFLQAITAFSLLGGGYAGFRLTNVWQGALVGAFIALAVVIAVSFMLAQKRAERLKRAGIADIDKMEGVQFENYLGYLFRAQGYKVAVTKAAGDFGADLIIEKDGKRIVVQAKRYSKNVGIKAVQEAQASIAHYGAVQAWVVSNSDYTQAAYELAKSNRVRLINREELIDIILSINFGTAPIPKAVMSTSPVDQSICPKCGGKLFLRSSSKGQFYGCSSFPKCRFIKVSSAV